MKIIKYPNNEILSNLGNPPIFDTNEYRFMKYCINVNVDEGILIYNYLTRALVLLTEEDINNLGNIKKYDFMYKWYFLVSPDFNEQLVVDTLRERFRIDKNNSSIVSRLIAATIEKGLIKDFDPDGNTKKFKKYIPYWA